MSAPGQGTFRVSQIAQRHVQVTQSYSIGKKAKQTNKNSTPTCLLALETLSCSSHDTSFLALCTSPVPATAEQLGNEPGSRQQVGWGGAGQGCGGRIRQGSLGAQYLEEEPEQTLHGTQPGRGRLEASDSSTTTLSEGRGSVPAQGGRVAPLHAPRGSLAGPCPVGTLSQTGPLWVRLDSSAG